MCCKIRRTFDPSRSRSQPQAHFFERRGKAASIWQKDASQNIHGTCTTCGRRMVRRFTHDHVRFEFQNPKQPWTKTGTHLRICWPRTSKRNNKGRSGSAVDLCHLKHAELTKYLQKYKERVVLWRDTVKGDDGYKAVFTEQGASASQVAAATLQDAISRSPSIQEKPTTQYRHTRR